MKKDYYEIKLLIDKNDMSKSQTIIDPEFLEILELYPSTKMTYKNATLKITLHTPKKERG